MPKILVGEQPFCAVFQKFLATKKFLKKRWKEYQRFQSKTFCLTVPQNWVGEAFCAVFQKISDSEKVLKKRGRSIKSFSESFLYHSAEKFVRGTTFLCCVSENLR